MKKEIYIQILIYLGIAFFFLGLGWFLGRTFGKVEIGLRELLIFLGIVLISISFLFPKKK